VAFFARRPSDRAIQRFIEQSRSLPLSYTPVGIAAHTPPGFDVDETAVAIDRGRAGFDRAKAALVAWKQFDLGWVELVPANASLESGTVLALLTRHLGFWSLNGARVVYGIGDRDSKTTFGIAYGTLSNHAESGEEIFEVFLRPESDEVIYRIRAASRPRAALARLGYPFVRFLQARFRRDSAEAMRRAVGEHAQVQQPTDRSR
jgi:uncharacterized protein (UPF0548 family)